MRVSLFKDGERAWYDGKGFIANPFNICDNEEEFNSWSMGWWSVQDKIEEASRAKAQAEYEAEVAKELLENEIKEKKKTKKGRAELAGQFTLF